MDAPIPFLLPFRAGRELEYLGQVVASSQIGGDMEFSGRCSRLLQERFGIHRVFITPSCTAALEMAALLCELSPGDEVLLPSFTYSSTANAVVRAGARPVFVDIRPDTLNLDPERLEWSITPRTRAIFPVHYGGVGCDMDRICALAERHGLRVVEDAAQGVHAFYRGRALGSLGCLGAYSFHETKNYSCGIGGALCVNDPDLVERAEVVRACGTNRDQFLRGVVNQYAWADVGTSGAAAELVCAFLYAQLERMEEVTTVRGRVHDIYRRNLQPLQDEGLLQLPHIPDACQSNYHLFYLLLPDRRLRDGLIAYLGEQRIQAVFHYVPLHTSEMGLRYGYRVGELPVTESVSGRLLRLPCYPGLTQGELERICRHVGRFVMGHAIRNRAA